MLRLLVLVVLCLIGFSSCERSENTGSDNFSCVIDGKKYEITGEYAFAQAIANDLFAIYGSEDQTISGFKNVYISFEGMPEEKKYSMNFGDPTSGNIVHTSNGDVFLSVFEGGEGTVEILEISDSRVKGEFSFVAVSADGLTKMVVENGSFDVPIK